MTGRGTRHGFKETLGALAVAAVACQHHSAADVRALLADVSFDALGHRRAGAN